MNRAGFIATRDELGVGNEIELHAERDECLRRLAGGRWHQPVGRVHGELTLQSFGPVPEVVYGPVEENLVAAVGHAALQERLATCDVGVEPREFGPKRVAV